MIKNKFVALIMAVALAFSFAACDSDSDSGKAVEQGEEVVGTNHPSDEPEVEEDAEPEPEPEFVVATFGDQFVWEDGLAVTVSEPKAFTPSEYAAGGEGYKHHVKFTITVVNDTGKPYDPSGFTETVQSGNREGDAVFDDGLEGSPYTTVLPGREVTFPVGYGVDNPNDLVMEISPDFDYKREPAIFTN